MVALELVLKRLGSERGRRDLNREALNPCQQVLCWEVQTRGRFSMHVRSGVRSEVTPLSILYCTAQVGVYVLYSSSREYVQYVQYS